MSVSEAIIHKHCWNGMVVNGCVIGVGLPGTASGTVTAASAGAFVGRGRPTRIMGGSGDEHERVGRRFGIGGA